MKKSEIAEKIFFISNLYADHLETGFSQEHMVPDFSSLDLIPEKKIVQKEELIEQKVEIEPRVIISTDEEITSKKRKIIDVAQEIMKCELCGLCANTRKVLGSGDIKSPVFILTFMPGNEEEMAGRILVGSTMEFFEKWMTAIQLKVQNLFITSILKCNPKNNPISKESIEICMQHMDKQLAVIKPKIILALGQSALSSLCRKSMDIHIYHGKLLEYKGLKVMATYHPGEVLAMQTKNPQLKKVVWEDLKKFQTLFQGL